MLIIAKNLKGLSFGALMNVYEESNRENAAEFWPDMSVGQRLLQAEQEFYQYLQEGFFTVQEAKYCIWQISGKYVSALRLEPYRDGWLLEALETAPDQRRKGYAEALIRAVLERCGNTKIYSHVGKHNEASLRVHEKCGFQRILEYAVYVDGSVNSRCCTLIHEK